MSDTDEMTADNKKNEEMSDESDDSDTDEVYEVESVLKERGKGKNKEYLVRWKNYGPKWDTWEPEANLEGAKEALNKFLQSKTNGSASGGSGGKAKGTKRGSTSTSSMTPKNKSGGKGGRGSGSSNAPKRVDKEELDSDNEEDEEDGEEGGGESQESDGEFEPTQPKKKKTTAGTSQQNGHKPGNRILKKRKGPTTSRQRRSTSRPVEQDSLTKAVNSRIAMNNNSKKGNAMSWISDSDDDSDTGGEGGGTKKDGGEKGFKKNEAIIPDLIVTNGTKNAEEAIDKGGKKTLAEKEKGAPKKAASELAESPPIDPGTTKEDEDKNGTKEGVRGESEPIGQKQESAKKLTAKATSSFPNNHRSTRSHSNSSSATIATEQLETTKNSITSTSTAIVDDGNGKHPPNEEEEEEKEKTNGKGRILRKRGTNARKNISAQQKPKSKIPSKILINTLFRCSNKLVAIVNSGTADSCQIRLSSTSEQKIVEVLKEELKKGPWMNDQEDEDGEEEEA